MGIQVSKIGAEVPKTAGKKESAFYPTEASPYSSRLSALFLRVGEHPEHDGNQRDDDEYAEHQLEQSANHAGHQMPDQ